MYIFYTSMIYFPPPPQEKKAEGETERQKDEAERERRSGRSVCETPSGLSHAWYRGVGGIINGTGSHAW